MSERSDRKVWRCLTRCLATTVAGAALLTLAGCRPGSFWSPDSTRLAVEARNSLYLFGLATKKFEKLPTGPGRPLNPAWSPDGKRLAYYRVVIRGQAVTAVSLAALDLQTRKESVLAPQLELPDAGKPNPAGPDAPDMLVKQMLSLCWSPDGKQIAFVSFVKGRGTLTFIPAAGGPVKRCVVPDADVLSPTWSPDGSQVAFFVDPQGKPGPGGIPAPHGRIEVRAARPGENTSRRVWLPPPGSDLNPAPNGPQWDRDSKGLGIVAEKTAPPPEGQPAVPGVGTAAEVWHVPLQGEAKRLVDVPGAALFTTVTPDCRQVIFIRATRQPNDPLVVALLSAPFGEARTLLQIPSPVPARPPGGAGNAPLSEGPPELVSLPVPVLSPDGKNVAVSLEERGKPARLWLASTGGGKPEEFTVPER